MRPDFWSLLISSAAAGAGAVHADTTCATCGDCSNRSTISVPAAVAVGLCTPSSEVTVISNCMSAWSNFSLSSAAASDDSEVGSWKPPEDRVLATGTPKIAAATMMSAATASTRRGAAIARRAILFSTCVPSEVSRLS